MYLPPIKGLSPLISIISHVCPLKIFPCKKFLRCRGDERFFDWCVWNRIGRGQGWWSQLDCPAAKLEAREVLHMSASKDSLVSSGCRSRTSVSGGPHRAVRIPSNAPAPDQWTLVREVNMEKREPCEVHCTAHRYLVTSPDNKCTTVLTCRYGDLEFTTNWRR